MIYKLKTVRFLVFFTERRVFLYLAKGPYLCGCVNNTRDYFASRDKAGGSNTLSMNSLRIWVFKLKRNCLV